MYTKQTWASGDTITAAKLNHIEDGIENAAPWDAVFRIDGSTSGAEPEYVAGDRDSVIAKLTDGDPVAVIAVKYDLSGSVKFNYTIMLDQFEYVGNGDLRMSGHSMNAPVPSFVWLSDNTCVWD